MSSIVTTSRIAIVGLGQLGGSLALRLQEIGCISLFGIARREDTLKQAIERNMIDAGSTDPEDVLPVVDITFICTPLPSTIEFIQKNLQHFRSGSIVTDVGSAKSDIVHGVRDLLYQNGVYFIGSHPMAGSENSGLEVSRSDLFQDSTVFLTPTSDDDSMAIDLVRDFWGEIGAKPVELNAQRHDEAVAFSSHILHFISSSLCNTVLGNGDVEGKNLACATGFKDMCRISASPGKMWMEVAKFNKEPILSALKLFQEEVQKVQDLIKAEKWNELQEYLEACKKLYQNWQNPKVDL